MKIPKELDLWPQEIYVYAIERKKSNYLGKMSENNVFNEFALQIWKHVRFSSNPLMLLSRLDPQSTHTPASAVIFFFNF